MRWVGSARRDLRAFPRKVRGDIGQAIFAAQMGDTDPDAKPLRGFGGAGVLEVIAPFDGDTFRAAYTVRFAGAIYVLHAFQKKATTRIATPKHHLNLIRQRLADAAQDYRRRQN